MMYNSKLDLKVTTNFMNVKGRALIPAFLLLLLFNCYFFIFNEGNEFVTTYVEIQKNLFFYLNTKLSENPNLQLNITQLGDVLILFPLLTLFIFYAPRIWGALFASSLISLVVSASLKKLLAVPRPAAMFDNDHFVIIGRTLSGKTSLPSGHSMTTFIVITILLFALMPQNRIHKFIWSFFVLTLGLFIAFSRVGVGAHYPLDVIIGCTIGYILAIIGIRINQKVKSSTWIKNRKYSPIFMVLFIIWGCIIIKKIINTNLIIFYLSLVSLALTLYLLANSYVKKKY